MRTRIQWSWEYKKYNVSGDLLESYNNLITPTNIKQIPNSNDMLFVTYNNPSIIQQLSSNGNISVLFSGAPLNGTSGIAIINDAIYISNFNDRRIFEYDIDNNTLTPVTQLPSIGPANSDFLGFIDAKDGYIIGTHIGGNQLFKVNPVTGETVSFAGSTEGSDDGDITKARFSGPNGIVADEENNRIYVSESNSKNLRIIADITLGTTNSNALLNTIEIFPNPGKDSLKISGKGLVNGLVTIWDVNGQKVIEQTVPNDSPSFSMNLKISQLSNGIYFVSILDNNNFITKKWIKE